MAFLDQFPLGSVWQLDGADCHRVTRWQHPPAYKTIGRRETLPLADPDMPWARWGWEVRPCDRVAFWIQETNLREGLQSDPPPTLEFVARLGLGCTPYQHPKITIALPSASSHGLLFQLSALVFTQVELWAQPTGVNARALDLTISALIDIAGCCSDHVEQLDGAWVVPPP